MSYNNITTQTQSDTSKIKHFNVFTDFNESLLDKFVDFHRTCIDEDVSEVFLYINSLGGYVNVFESMQAIMNTNEIAYHTINLSYAISCGLLLSAQGSIRWAQPNSWFMFHDAASFHMGKTKEVEESLDIVKIQMEQTIQQFANQTKKTADWWLSKAYENKSGDFYFSSAQALEYGVIDCIGVPTISRNSPVYVNVPLNPDSIKKMCDDRHKKNTKHIKDQLKVTTEKKPTKTVKRNRTPVKTNPKKTVKKTTKKVTKKAVKKSTRK